VIRIAGTRVPTRVAQLRSVVAGCAMDRLPANPVGVTAPGTGASWRPSSAVGRSANWIGNPRDGVRTGTVVA
jgi:hypothetical protein